MSPQEWLPLALVGVAALVYAVRQALELMGLSPGSELLRTENADLLRRNGELEQTVARHENLLADLRRKVEDLEKTNQAAVLEALRNHEAGAMPRHAENQALLARAVNALETGG